VPSEPGFSLYPYESLVAAGRVSGQNCSCMPVKVLPWYLGTLVGSSEPLNTGVNDVTFGRFIARQHAMHAQPDIVLQNSLSPWKMYT